MSFASFNRLLTEYNIFVYCYWKCLCTRPTVACRKIYICCTDTLHVVNCSNEILLIYVCMYSTCMIPMV